MAKLYPPQINGTIPAFYSDEEEGTTNLVVPFSMNRAVSIYEISGMVLKIKSLNGTLLGVVQSDQINSTDMTATFDVNSLIEKLTIGSYYKVQVAYIDKDYGTVGYYSTVGVIKYTTLPSVSIVGLSLLSVNNYKYEYIGLYSQSLENSDATEKLYSSQFIIYKGTTIVYDSGEILHNNTDDESRYEARESIKLLKELDIDELYTICFKITTVNGLKVTSPYYRIMVRKSIDPTIDVELVAESDYDNGCVNLTLDPVINGIFSGNFIISRCDNINDWSWSKIKEFTLLPMKFSSFSFKDYTVEQGITYKYSIQQINTNGFYSNKIISNTVDVDFEDAYLFDGERQLKIRFNPKVSSFKIDLQESKSDTIGHQYPFFTRNSHIYYREFPISGLISYLMDENELFITKDELGMETISYDSRSSDDEDLEDETQNRYFYGYNTTTNLTAKNISAERLFKMTVLEWLNNGKPKVFKSPGEGNFVVRLMNVSLSPNDTLSRMLHTFSCTAYEIAAYTMENLEYYDIYNLEDLITEQKYYKSINLSDFVEELIYNKLGLNYNLSSDQEYYSNLSQTEKNQALADIIENNGNWATVISGADLYNISLTDMVPGSEIRIDGESIIIGTTGAYQVKNSLNPFSLLEFNLNNSAQGLITYSYIKEMQNNFSIIENIKIEDVPCHQFIGNSYQKTEKIYNDNGIETGTIAYNNIFDIINNCRSYISKVKQLKVYKRPIIDGFINTDLSITAIRSLLNSGITSAALIEDISFDIFSENSSQTLYLKDYSSEVHRPYQLPLYQLRMPRTDYRETESIYDIVNFKTGETETYTYIYKDAKAYTFEQYYIDKHMDTYAPYLGYFYDPNTGKIFVPTDDLFSFYIDDENIDLTEIETWKNDSFDSSTSSIIFNNGVIGELSYIKHNYEYSFDSDYENDYTDIETLTAKQYYEECLAKYLLAREGRKNAYFTSDLLNYIETYLPNAYKKYYSNNFYYNNYIVQLIDISDASYTSSSKTMSTWLKEQAENTTTTGYYNQINNLKEYLDNAYNNYISKLESTIKQYEEEHGIE